MNRDPALRAVDGVAIPRVGLGCMGMSEFYGERDDAQSLRALHLAHDLGYRHFDSADIYGSGHNEELLARFLRERGPARRDDVYLATKVGIRRIPGSLPTIETDSSPAYVESACNASLRRLGVDHVDLLYLHRRSRSVPIEDTAGALATLVQKGKVLAVGLSEVSADTLRRANAVMSVAAVQSEYSLWSRDVEGGVVEACAELGVAFVAYSPLGRGFLSGQLTRADIAGTGDLRQHLPRFTDANFAANLALLDGLRKIAAELDVTMAETAIAWVLSRAPFIYTIPGARSEAHLRINFAGHRLTISRDRLAALSAHFAPHAVSGERLPVQLLKTVDT